MTFNEFSNSNDVTYLWICGEGHELKAGIDLKHDVDTDCAEDYCDLTELLSEEQFDWLGELKGEVVNGQWSWDGEGDPRYLSNSVTNVKAY